MSALRSGRQLSFSLGTQICEQPLHGRRRSQRTQSARGQSLIDNFNGSTEVPTFSLINEPAGLILVISLALCLLSGIWMGESNND